MMDVLKNKYGQHYFKRSNLHPTWGLAFKCITLGLAFKGKEQSYFSNNFIVLNHKQICFITIYDGCLT